MGASAPALGVRQVLARWHRARPISVAKTVCRHTVVDPASGELVQGRWRALHRRHSIALGFGLATWWVSANISSRQASRMCHSM